jgi:hypothetical protein
MTAIPITNRSLVHETSPSESSEKGNLVSQVNSRAAETEQRRYYCRGCGRPLVAGVRSHFHSECLKSDKKERVRKQRRLERMRFEAWLHRQHCPKCGARYDTLGSECVERASCETSRPIQGGD